MPARVSAVSIVDAVADDLRQRILRGDIAPETAFTEVSIAEQYTVARATGKAAIEKLVAEALLERRTNKTARVVTLGPDEVRDIYDTRARLEKGVLVELAKSRTVPAGAMTAQKELEALDESSDFDGYDIVDPDMRFHMALVDAVESPLTSRMYSSLVSQVKLCMAQIQGMQLVAPRRIIHEHRHLLTLIEAGDGDAAAEFLDEHLSRPRELLVAAVGGAPGPEADAPSSLSLE